MIGWNGEIWKFSKGFASRGADGRIWGKVMEEPETPYRFKKWRYFAADGWWIAIFVRPNGREGEFTRAELDEIAADPLTPDSFRAARLEALACEPDTNTPRPERHDEAME